MNAHRLYADSQARRRELRRSQRELRHIVRRLAVVAVAAAAAGFSASSASAAIYWANLSTNTIGVADLDGGHVNQSLISGADAPSDLVVEGQHIYWSNATGGCAEYGSCDGTIAVANLNGTDVNEDLIPAVTPYGLTADSQYIYWSNSGSTTIGRANLAGSDVNQDFITGLNGPNGVVVNGQNIYWASTGSDSIGEANINGTDVNPKFITGTNGPEGMAIDGQYIYWANHNGGSIGRATLAGTDVNEDFIPDAGAWPTRVAVDAQNIYWTTWAQNAVPTDGTIGVANINGTDVNNDLISSPSSPVGVWVTAGPAPTSGSGTKTSTTCGRRAETIGVAGPTANVFHTYFDETVSGSSCGAADYVISGEQLYPAGGCAATYLAESRKSDWYQWPTGTGAVRGHFRLVARFWARNHQKHGICTYLVNRATRQTYAHASRWWNNS